MPRRHLSSDPANAPNIEFTTRGRNTLRICFGWRLPAYENQKNLLSDVTKTKEQLGKIALNYPWKYAKRGGGTNHLWAVIPQWQYNC